MLFVWSLARQKGSEVLLRMEDHDRGRCKASYEAEILADLRWLGLHPDSGLALDGESTASPYRQSDCHAVYEEAFAMLQAQGLCYGCRCSRKEILARTGQTEGELRYDNYCRDLGLSPAADMTWRMRLPEDSVRFHDYYGGVQQQDPGKESGDLAIRDRNGHWTYHFCVVVDDMRHGVDWIIRGEDLFTSTGRQILLGKCLGQPTPPAYAHHPLLATDDGRKLSKRDFDAPLRTLRLEGASSEAVLAQALCAMGVAGIGESISLEEALSLIRQHWPISDPDA